MKQILRVLIFLVVPFFLTHWVLGSPDQSDDISVDELIALNVANTDRSDTFSIRFQAISGKIENRSELSGEFSQTTGKVQGRWVRLAVNELYETRLVGELGAEFFEEADGTRSAKVPFPGSETVLRSPKFELKLSSLVGSAIIGRSQQFHATASFEPYHGMLTNGDGKYVDPVMLLVDPPVALRNQVYKDGDLYVVHSIFGELEIKTTFDGAANFLITHASYSNGGLRTEFGILETYELPNGAYIPRKAFGLFAHREGEFPLTAHLWTATDMSVHPKPEELSVTADRTYQLRSGDIGQIGGIRVNSVLSPEILPDLYLAASDGRQFATLNVNTVDPERSKEETVHLSRPLHIAISIAAGVLIMICVVWSLKSRKWLGVFLVIFVLFESEQPATAFVDDSETISVYRFKTNCSGSVALQKILLITSPGYFSHSGYALLNSPNVLEDLKLSDAKKSKIELALNAQLSAARAEFQKILPHENKTSTPKFLQSSSHELIEKENDVRSLLSSAQIHRLNQIDQYLTLRQCGATYLSELMTYEESLEENLKATITTQELDLKLKAFEKGHELWLATLNKIPEYLPENSEAREWWGERRDRFADAIYADLICQFSELETFDAYLGKPLHEWSFPEVFQVDWQLQLDADGRWRWWKLGADGSMQKFFRLEQSLWFQQHQSDGNELDLSVDQITHLSDIRQRVSEEAYAIPDLKQSQYHAIALKHITHAWNDVLLPRQRDMIVELMRERCRTMAGPLEVLFRPELEDKTKVAIRKEFESCRKQLLEIEAQLMADLLSVLKKELNIPNLITGQARPKYLQPSLCLLELHLTKHGRLPQPKSEIE